MTDTYYCGVCCSAAGHIPRDCPTLRDATGRFDTVKYDAWLESKRDYAQEKSRARKQSYKK
jgi:hypothetical protein